MEHLSTKEQERFLKLLRNFEDLFNGTNNYARVDLP